MYSIRKIVSMSEAIPDGVRKIIIKLYREGHDQDLDHTFAEEDDDATILRESVPFAPDGYHAVKKSLREMALMYFDREFMVKRVNEEESTVIMNYKPHCSVKERMGFVCNTLPQSIFVERMYENSAIVTCTFTTPLQGVDPATVKKNNLYLTVVNGTRQAYFLHKLVENIKITSFNYYLQVECPNIRLNAPRFRLATELLLSITERVLKNCESCVQYLDGIPFAAEATDDYDDWVENTEVRLLLAAERQYIDAQKSVDLNSTY